MNNLKKIILVLAAIGLSGCVAMTAVPAGPVATEAAFTVDASSSWTRMAKALTQTQGSILTKDGRGLNQVHVLTIEGGKKMILSMDKAKNFPIYEKGQSQLRQVEFITTNLSRLGFENIKSKNVEPARVGGIDGLKMQLVGQYPNGLNMKGKVALAENDSGLNVVMYLAPEQYYYDKYLDEVDGLIGSISYAK